MTTPTQITIHPPSEPAGNGFFAENTARIGDALDVINPLQHIPFVNTLYRELTGDTIGAGATIAGGALFGGVFGLFAGLANVIFKDATGESVGDAVVTALRGEHADPNMALAQNEVNLGDFAGDARRRVCSYGCSEAPVAVAAAEVEQTPIPVASAATGLPSPKAEKIAIASPASATERATDKDILALFGASAAPAAASVAYGKADMRGYLREASIRRVI